MSAEDDRKQLDSLRHQYKQACELYESRASQLRTAQQSVIDSNVRLEKARRWYAQASAHADSVLDQLTALRLQVKEDAAREGEISASGWSPEVGQRMRRIVDYALGTMIVPSEINDDIEAMRDWLDDCRRWTDARPGSS